MKLKYEFEFIEIDDMIAAVPVGENSQEFCGVIKLNSTAADIFSLLKNDISEETIINELLLKYDVSIESVTEYVHGFINKLDESGMII